MDESGGEGGGENFIWVWFLLCRVVVDVDTEVSESEIEVPIGVNMGERKDMVFSERRLRRIDCVSFTDSYFHFSGRRLIGRR